MRDALSLAVEKKDAVESKDQAWLVRFLTMGLDQCTIRPRWTIVLVVLALVAGACGSSDTVEASLDDNAGDINELDTSAAVTTEPAATVEPAPTTAPTVEPTPTPMPDPTATPVPVPDPTVMPVPEARAVESLYTQPAGPDGWPIATGDWISHSFSVPLFFTLPVDGTVINEGAGRLEIAVGDPDALDGFLLIVEPLALNSPTGPIPINLVDADTAFQIADVLGEYLIEEPDRSLDVTDARFPDNPAFSQFRSVCDRNPSYRCLEPFLTLSNYVYFEQELTHRFISQDWADGRLIVVATPLDEQDESFRGYADLIATSAQAVPASTHEGTRWMAANGDRATEIPAGRYVARVGDTALAITLDATLPNVRVNAIRPSVLGFAAVDGDSPGSGWLRFFDFDNFLDPDTGETRGDPGADPLTTEQFEAGLAEWLVIEQTGTDVIGGVASTWFDATAEQGVGESCALALGWPNPDATCVRWARMLNPYAILQPSDVVGRHYYLADADLLLVVSPQPGFTADDVLADLQPILDRLHIAVTRPSSGPVTIEAEARFSTRPVVGTFEVTEGADILGCSSGTYEDTYDVDTEDVDKLMTCTEPNTGTFTIVFDPDGYDIGPGEQNGPWRILDGSSNFAELKGEGDFWMVTNGPETGSETYSGHIEYTS